MTRRRACAFLPVDTQGVIPDAAALSAAFSLPGDIGARLFDIAAALVVTEDDPDGAEGGVTLAQLVTLQARPFGRPHPRVPTLGVKRRSRAPGGETSFPVRVIPVCPTRPPRATPTRVTSPLEESAPFHAGDAARRIARRVDGHVRRASRRRHRWRKKGFRRAGVGVPRRARDGRRRPRRRRRHRGVCVRDGGHVGGVVLVGARSPAGGGGGCSCAVAAVVAVVAGSKARRSTRSGHTTWRRRRHVSTG